MVCKKLLSSCLPVALPKEGSQHSDTSREVTLQDTSMGMVLCSVDMPNLFLIKDNLSRKGNNFIDIIT